MIRCPLFSLSPVVGIGKNGEGSTEGQNHWELEIEALGLSRLMREEVQTRMAQSQETR